MYTLYSFYICFDFRKVFLGQKQGAGNDDKLYAIKVMKKSEMVNKNLVSQGMTYIQLTKYTTHLFLIH